MGAVVVSSFPHWVIRCAIRPNQAETLATGGLGPWCSRPNSAGRDLAATAGALIADFAGP